MAKQVKSFNVDEAAYKSMVALLKEYDTEASTSSLLDKCLKELLHYFQTMQDELGNCEERKEIMRFIIDRMAGSELIHTPDKHAVGEGDPGLNPLSMKSIEPREFIAKVTEAGEPLPETKGVLMWEVGSEPASMAEIFESELDEEVHYWRDEYEANKEKLSRAFIKHLRSGKFLLSQDKKYLIDKETGKRYVDFAPNYIVEIATDAGKK
jgi:hypothetical protein